MSMLKRAKSHGLSNSPTYRIWGGAVQRCTNPRNSAFKYYGGRGIRICERWMKFENFVADMGERPVGMTLDRIDSDGHYEPGNCRWVSRKGQQRNRRDTRRFTHGGVTRSLKDWAEITGLSPDTIFHRIKRGWPAESVLAKSAAKSNSVRRTDRQYMRNSIGQFCGGINSEHAQESQ